MDAQLRRCRCRCFGGKWARCLLGFLLETAGESRGQPVSRSTESTAMRPVPEPGGRTLAALAESLQPGEQQPLDRRTSARLVRTSGGSLTLSSDRMGSGGQIHGHARTCTKFLNVASPLRVVVRSPCRSCGAAMRCVLDHSRSEYRK